MAGTKIKAGDTVLVRAGKDKGVRGTVLKVYRDSDRVLVEGVNRVVRNTKVTPGASGAKEGGQIHREAPINISNVMLVDSDGKATRVGSRPETADRTRSDGSSYTVTRRVRVSRRTGKDVS